MFVIWCGISRRAIDLDFSGILHSGGYICVVWYWKSKGDLWLLWFQSVGIRNLEGCGELLDWTSNTAGAGFRLEQ